jgi:hypothetical protein
LLLWQHLMMVKLGPLMVKDKEFMVYFITSPALRRAEPPMGSEPEDERVQDKIF